MTRLRLYMLCCLVLVMGCVECLPNPDYSVSATVVFNFTNPRTNENTLYKCLDISYYGSHSQPSNVSGRVVLTALEKGNFFGCLSNAYAGRTLEEPWVALVERGDCTFSEKLKQAALANASGIIVYDSMSSGTVTMVHADQTDIVAVSIPRDNGLQVQHEILSGSIVTVDITTGDYIISVRYHQRTSVIFVSLAFLIMLIISMTWLVIYYVQRFRIMETPHSAKRQAMVKKIVGSLPKRLLVARDEEICNNEICPICIEVYKIEDSIRMLPCQHVFHRRCVDTWLIQRETCPLCKYNILKPAKGLSSTRETTIILGMLSPTVEIWEPDQSSSTSTNTLFQNDTESDDVRSDEQLDNEARSSSPSIEIPAEQKPLNHIETEVV